MADRQTALAVFDFLDSLRAGQYRIGADAEKDHATAGLLASLSGDTGLRDAVCAKLISPGLERARFLMVAEHDPRALPLFASGQVKPWYQADYNVREIANSEFHQDIPALLWRLSNTIPDSARREGMLEAAAYMSFMQGDPEAAFTGHLGRLAAVSPEGEVTRCLMDAHEHGQHPAWVMEQRQLRERENAADVLADLQAWWKTSQPDMRQHVDEMMAGIDAAMEPLDKRLYAAAEKEFKERALDPDGECYQLDGGTFISQESFDGICGDQRDRYMAWKNQAEPARLVSAWDDPARLDRLVGDLIDADDGGGCLYTDAQPIDYTQGMDYSPQQLAADSGLGDTVPLACESNASYSLAHHPDIKFTATGSPDGRKALEVSAPGSARHALITAKPGAFDVSLHDERGIVSGESFPYEANDSWTYRLSGQALRGALDLAVGWADPQETSPETAGLGLALDDGMETTHGR